MIEAPVQISDEYVKTYLWEHNLVAIDEGDLKKLMREWQGLTDEEIREIVGVTSADSDWNVTIVHKWIRAIEAKLKEKNT